MARVVEDLIELHDVWVACQRLHQFNFPLQVIHACHPRLVDALDRHMPRDVAHLAIGTPVGAAARGEVGRCAPATHRATARGRPRRRTAHLADLGIEDISKLAFANLVTQIVYGVNRRELALGIRLPK